MMNKTVLLITVSCVSLYTGALSYADIHSYHTPPRLSGAADTKSHNLYTPHLVAAHLSSPEDFSLLPSDSFFSHSQLDRESRSEKTANSFNLDPRIKSEDDTSLVTSLLKGRRKENNPVNCFLTTGAELLICDPATATEANVTVAADRSKLVLPSPQHLRSQTVGLRSRTDESDKIKLTSVCFVTDTGDCSGNEFSNADSENGHGAPGGPGDDFDLDNAERCRQEGYTQTSCPEDSDPVNFCPYDNTYFERCQANCPSNYVTCEPPYYGVGEACGDKYAFCEKDTERACQELNPGYTDNCGSGQKLSDDRCSYDNSYGICCDTCSGYPYTTDSIPNGYVQDGEACVDCDGNQKVKVKPNPCDGFMDCGSVGPETGANTCLSGTTTLYDNCKPCPNLGIYDSCPSPYTCSFEDCSNKYYPTGCKSGYVWNANNKTCTCDTSVYKYACTGTDQKGSGQACDGKYKSCTCSNGKTWNGKECVCASSYKYTCNGTGYAGGSGDECSGKYKSCTCASGYEWKNGNCQKEITQAEWGNCNGYAEKCETDDILFSDGTCASGVTPGKTPIAVVIFKSGGCGYAIALKSLGEYQWGEMGIYINSQGGDCYEITADITAAGSSSTFPAAWAAKNYKTAGTVPGNWCLPTSGIIGRIHSLTDINKSLNLVGGDPLGTAEIWSSSERDSHNAFGSDFSKSFSFLGDPIPYGKDSSFEVRPVIEF